MRVLIVSQYFWPESFIINELVKTLSHQGNYVRVLTGKPNYPDGQIFAGYQERGCSSETFVPGVNIFRAPLRPRRGGGGKNLAFNYLSFVINGLRYFPRAVKGETYDVILAIGLSPITSVIPAILLKKQLKIPLAVWIQDLWPESLSATGFITNRFVLHLMGRLVRWIYMFTDMLLVQSQSFRKVVSKYASEEKIVYYPNSYLEIISDHDNDALIPRDLLLELERNFCLVFAGNLGTAQSIETLLKASERLTHLSGCKIILIGSGSMSGWVEQQIALKGLNNLVLVGRLPSSTMPSIFSRAAGLLVSLKQNEILTYTIPCKIQAYLAAGRPVIAALDGEGAQVIDLAGAGFVSPAEDAAALAKNIERLYRMPIAMRNKLGESGRAYFLKHFEMERQSLRLIEILEKSINIKRDSK